MYLLAGMVLLVETGSLVSAALTGAGCSGASSVANLLAGTQQLVTDAACHSST
jgi:hydroxyethylthiazole kinase-like sugar kinase family protein